MSIDDSRMRVNLPRDKAARIKSLDWPQPPMEPPTVNELIYQLAWQLSEGLDNIFNRLERIEKKLDQTTTG